MSDEMKGKTILAVVAHADDLDFGCAGSIAKWAKDGAVIHYLILTDGSKGSEDMSITNEELAKMRVEEQKNAADVLGVKEVHFGGFTDGELYNTPELRYAIVKLIRELKPDRVLTTDPTFVYSEEFGFINHPDHRNAGQATLDSVFPFARNSRTFPDLLEEGLKPHSVLDVCIVNFVRGNYVVDISDTFDLKIKALEKHQSQLGDIKGFKERMKERASMIGKNKGYKLAESFVRIQLRG